MNNKNKTNPHVVLNYETRLNITGVGKKLLICLPPKVGVGDAIEYGIAIYSLIQNKKFDNYYHNSFHHIQVHFQLKYLCNHFY